MESWQIELLKQAGVAAIGFISGIGALWLKLREREKDRQAEYEEFKKKRRLIGSGEVEKMERFDKLTGIIIKTKAHNITQEEIDRYRDMMNVGKKRPTTKAKAEPNAEIKSGAPLDLASVEAFIFESLSSKMPPESRRLTAKKSLAIISDRGPNQLPIGYDDEGNLVEWIPHDEDDEADPNEPYWPIMLLRDRDAIHDASQEFFEKVWWNRHEALKHKGKRNKELPWPGEDKAKEIEAKYGRDQLLVDEFQWGMINGKLSALRWVSGSEWDFLDT